MRKHSLLVIGIIALAALVPLQRAQAAEDTPSRPVSSILCQPDAFSLTSAPCEARGPAAKLDSLAAMGFTFPAMPLPAIHPDPALTQVNVRYGQVQTQRAPVYGTLEDAVKGKKKNAVSRIDSSFSYISYTEEAIVDGKRFYMIAPGAWMTAADISRIGVVPLFQGRAFTRTPEHAFGWVLAVLGGGTIETKRTPGFNTQDYSGHFLQNHALVQVYAVENVAGDDWYMVGPDEWVYHTVVARVTPQTTPPEGVTGDRWIEVNLYEQTLAVYQNRELVYATLIASGIDPFWTRPGLFQIYEKLETTPMRGAFEADRSDAYYLEDVPWTMYFDQARALHGAYWRANLGFPQSHGCVNLSVGDSRWLFDWAQVGDWVYVWDPSGKTPEDPDLYTAGGA